MKKTVNIIPFEKLSIIFNNIKYDCKWIFSNGVNNNIIGNFKSHGYLIKLIFSKRNIKKYYDESFLKRANKIRFYYDKKPMKNWFSLTRNYKL